MKKRGKLYMYGNGNVDKDKKGDMKNGGKASGKGVSAGFALLLAGVLLLAFSPPPALAQTAIATCEELQNMKDDLTGDYYLANDINCSGFDYGDGKGFMPIGTSSSKFTGTFDCKGYKITNLYINRPSTDYVGLFGYTGSGSEIKNVGLEEVNVNGRNYVGGLVGCNHRGTIRNSYSSGTVSGSGHVGGLYGRNYKGTIRNSYSSGTVHRGYQIVGLPAVSVVLLMLAVWLVTRTWKQS